MQRLRHALQVLPERPERPVLPVPLRLPMESCRWAVGLQQAAGLRLVREAVCHWAAILRPGWKMEA